MKLHKQEHLITETSQRGSCYPTVLACLLDKELHEVPNFYLFYWTDEERQNIFDVFTDVYCKGDRETALPNERDNFNRNFSISGSLWGIVLEAWLASLGYKEARISIEKHESWLLENKDIFYMASGITSRDTKHVVIYQNGKLFHDTHPSNEGLVQIDNYSVLKKVK